MRSDRIPASVTPSLHLAEAVAMASLLPLNVDQYQQMIQQGIVPEDSTIELLPGVLVRKNRSGGRVQLKVGDTERFEFDPAEVLP